jgi:retron-type reverse transcriptase
MKRYGNLWPQITTFENLWCAANKAQKGKRFSPSVLHFNFNRETELLNLQESLLNQTYQPGSYTTFEILIPKKRMISAAPYRDRVVHHALCNIISPCLEEALIDKTYANRVGLGSHRALRQFTHYLRTHRYVLQCDIRRYFPSIDHEILKTLIRRKIKCPETLWLIDTIIDNSNPQESIEQHFPGDDLLTPLERRKGLPIGNLTSQTFANFYLYRFDHFVTETLKIKYVRYVDDFALFSNNYEQLAQIRNILTESLDQLRLKIHPIKNQLFETRHGATFVGFRVLPTHIRVCTANLRMGRRRLRYYLKQYRHNQIDELAIRRSLNSWLAHVAHADSYQLRSKILQIVEEYGIDLA